MLKYFITCLPRSRAAWVSNYLSYGNSMCIFNATKFGLMDGSGPDCLEKFSEVAPIVGFADPALLQYQDFLIEKYPQAKWIIIERKYDDVVESARKLGFEPSNTLVVLSNKLQELKGKLKDPMIVKYEDLNEKIDGIAKFIDPEWSAPKERHEMLIELNVQMDLELGLQQYAKIPVNPEVAKRIEPITLSKTNQEYVELVKEICGTNHAAFRWFMQVVEVALTWDHLVDSDPLDKIALDKVFKSMILEWPINQFLVENARSLIPILSEGISAWQYSFTDGASRDDSYQMYRELPMAIALILRGVDGPNKYYYRVRKLVEQLRREDDKRDSI